MGYRITLRDIYEDDNVFEGPCLNDIRYWLGTEYEVNREDLDRILELIQNDTRYSKYSITFRNEREEDKA